MKLEESRGNKYVALSSEDGTLKPSFIQFVKAEQSATADGENCSYGPTL